MRSFTLPRRLLLSTLSLALAAAPIRGQQRPVKVYISAVMFIAYHRATTSVSGVRAHTISSALLTRIALNGTPMSEAGINAAIAAEFAVPVVLITGDDAIVNESRERFGAIDGVIVKR